MRSQLPRSAVFKTLASERRLAGQQFTKLGRKHQHDWLYLQSINYIVKTTFRVWCLYSYLVHGEPLDYRARACAPSHEDGSRNKSGAERWHPVVFQRKVREEKARSSPISGRSALQRKSHLFIPRKGMARPQSQFPHLWTICLFLQLFATCVEECLKAWTKKLTCKGEFAAGCLLEFIDWRCSCSHMLVFVTQLYDAKFLTGKFF